MPQLPLMPIRFSLMHHWIVRSVVFTYFTMALFIHTLRRFIHASGCFQCFSPLLYLHGAHVAVFISGRQQDLYAFAYRFMRIAYSIFRACLLLTSLLNPLPPQHRLYANRLRHAFVIACFRLLCVILRILRYTKSLYIIMHPKIHNDQIALESFTCVYSCVLPFYASRI